MKYLLLTLCLWSVGVYAQSDNKPVYHSYDEQPKVENDKKPVIEAKKTTMVYVCNSSGAYRYHSKESCTGYMNCKHTESSIAIDSARARNYTPCKICKPE